MRKEEEESEKENQRIQDWDQLHAVQKPIEVEWSSKEQQRCLTAHEAFLNESWSLVTTGHRPLLVELCCEPTSILTQTCHDKLGDFSAFRLSHWNGFDLETSRGIEATKLFLKNNTPKVLWIATECGPFSPIQHLNQRDERQRTELEEKRVKARQQYEGGRDIARYAHSLGIVVVWEWSERCEAWRHEDHLKFMEQLNMRTAVCKGCQVNLREPSGRLLCKGWRLATTWVELSHHMNLTCPGNHAKGKCEGSGIVRMTAFYTPQFAKRVISFLMKHEPWSSVVQELQDGISRCNFSAVSDFQCLVNEEQDRDDAKDLDDLPSVGPLTKEQQEKIMQAIKRIHSATGHCSKKFLLQALRRRNVPSQVYALAKQFERTACQERARPDPRCQSTLEHISGKWETLQIDFGQWQHPESRENFHFILAVDEGTRLRVGQIVHQGKHYHVSAEDVKTFLRDKWFPFFGYPHRIRVDPDGAWRSINIDMFLTDCKIGLDFTAPEAHWQIGVVESSIGQTKSILDALCSDNPEMDPKEAFCRAMWAQNQRDLYLGFSPIQHAFGRSFNSGNGLSDKPLKDLPIITENGVSAQFGKDMQAMHLAEKTFLEEQSKERLRRAQNSGHRRMTQVIPGDLVFAWRKATARQEGNQSLKGGKYVGPYRVLATETKTDGSNLLPGQCVWLFRGNRLTKATHSQLRPATDREEAWQELEKPHEIPWTISTILQDSRRKTFDDITEDAKDMPDEDMFDLSAPADLPIPSHRHREKKPVKRPTSEDSLDRCQRPRNSNQEHDEGGIKREGDQTETRLRKQLKTEDFSLFSVDYAISPSPFWNNSDHAVEIEVELPKVFGKRGKQMMRDMRAFVVSQMKKNHVEVCERKLSQEEKEEFRKAKYKEVNNYISSQVFTKLPDHLKPSADQAMNMRWVLTWKFDAGGARKAKARCVILGYQDPLYEYRPTASPTMTRTTRQIFLQLCANHGFSVYKGDVSGAFLQGLVFQRDAYCIPVKELCEALEVPEGSITKLNKAAYGLVEAPLQWYLSISSFLESLGLERQFADPCCWSLFDSQRKPLGWICGHVDDFLFGGDEGNEEWNQVISKVKNQYKWGDWECNHFVQCGTTIQRSEDGGFCLSQPDFLDLVEEAYIPKDRLQETSLPVSDAERQQMRSILGSLSWYASQTAMHLSSAVGLQLSKVTRATVADLVECNRILKRARTWRHHKLKIHPMSPQDFTIACWTDAAHANRWDGSSTQGIFVGFAEGKLEAGEMSKVSPLYWQSAKIQRKCRSPAAAETCAAVNGEDETFAIRFQVAEFLGRPISIWNVNQEVAKIRSSLISDSKNLYDRLSKTMVTLRGEEKRSDLESMCLKESMDSTELQLRWVNGEAMLANSLTKPEEHFQIIQFYQLGGRWRITYDQSMMSGKKRKAKGLNPFESNYNNSIPDQNPKSIKEDLI